MPGALLILSPSALYNHMGNVMHYLKLAVTTLILGALLGGCTTLQTANKVDTANLHNV